MVLIAGWPDLEMGEQEIYEQLFARTCPDSHWYFDSYNEKA